MHEQLRLGAVKVRGLLGYLAYRVNEPVHVDRIAEALWDDDDRPADPGKVLQTYVSRLRRVFRDSRCPADVTREFRSYRLETDQTIVDYHGFRTKVRNGHRARGRGNLNEAAGFFTSALRMWTGPLLADLNTIWARQQRETLTTSELIPAHCGLFDTKLALGDHEFVLHELPRLLAERANDEQLATQWIRALAAAGRSGEVPAFYREFTQRLLEDLGVSPSLELAQTFREVAGERRPALAMTGPGPSRATPYFTGRADLIEQLDELLAGDDRDVDVVALDGLPGVGKTTLAKQWARLRHKRFPDGVLCVDMFGYSDLPLAEPHAVMGTFLAELGVGTSQIPNGTTERAALLRHTLSTRDVLVILDNVRDSAHARPLLAAMPNCRTLITSRRQLTGIVYRDGVHRLAVPALPADDAAGLLEKRVGGRVAEEPTAIAKLVELCDGLPLALRIAGEHIAARPAVPLADLAEELLRARRLLDAGAHGDDHTSTLRSTFSWSYQALREREQRAFRLVGVHPGTRFDVRAACAMLGDDSVEDVEHLLDSLVGAHLVAQERAGRYLVHDLLHAYASDIALRHEPAEALDHATRRLFDWYLGSARHAHPHLARDDQEVPGLPALGPVEPVDFADGDAALTWLLAERANLVACTYRAAELGFHEHVWRFAACLEVLSRYESPLGLLEIHELGRRSAELAGQTAAVGGCLNNKGTSYAKLNDHVNAGRCFELAHQAFTEADDRHGIAVTMHNTGATYLSLGQPAEGIRWLSKALAMHTSERPIANTHLRLGDAYRMLDQLAEARSHYRRASYSSQKADYLAGQAASLRSLAQLSLAQDEVEEAIQYGQAALDVFDRVHVDRAGTATTLMTLADAHLRHGTHTTAVAMADEAVRTYREMRHSSGEIDGLVVLGRAFAAAGEPAEATRAWVSAGQLFSSPTDPRADVVRSLLAAHGDQPIPTPRTNLGPASAPETTVAGDLGRAPGRPAEQ
jgi:DNA-binding SARP family transcriptional activator/tetratricopeptide (TPR) repeat protein